MTSMDETAESRPQPDAQNTLAMRLVGFAAGAGVGALIGFFILARFGDIFLGNVPNLPLFCALGAGVVGGLSGYIKVEKQLRRQRQTREAAAQLGFDYALKTDGEIRRRVRNMFSGTGSVQLENVLRKEVDAVRFVIADLVRTTRSGSGKNSSSHTTRRTMAYLESDQLQFPEFTLQPEGALLNMFSKVVGVNDIDFEDAPEFSKRYHLSGREPDQTRAFFQHPLRDYFAANKGLEVRAEGGRLVLLHASVCKPDQLGGFIEQAMQVFSLFMDAAADNE